MKRRSSLLPYLVVGDETDLAHLAAVVATLPMCATGRVFVECAEPGDAVELGAPQRMTVTWLARSERSGAPGSCAACPRGEAVGRAVAAWAAEMVDEQTADAMTVILTGDYRTVAAAHESIAERSCIADERISLDEGYRLRRGR